MAKTPTSAAALWSPDRSWPSRAGRYALSLLEPTAADGSDEEIIDAFTSLRDRWRKQLELLYGGYWQSDSAWEHAANCPPLGIKSTKRRYRPCRRRHLCPFCWGRQYAVTPYKRLVAALRQPDLPPLRLVEATAVQSLACGLSGEGMLQMRQYCKQSRDRLLRRVLKRSFGGFSLAVLDPRKATADDSKTRPWQGQLRALLLWPESRPFPELADKGFTPEGAEEPLPLWQLAVRNEPLATTPEGQLAAACGRVALFPTGLMAHLPEQFNQYAEVRYDDGTAARWRAAEYYGALRTVRRTED